MIAARRPWILVFALAATFAGDVHADTLHEDDRRRFELWLDTGAYERADSLATVLYEAAPEGSAEQADALLLVVRAARTSGSIPLDTLVRIVDHLIGVQRELFGDDDPRLAEAHHELGSVHVRRGDQTAAAVAYRQALERRRVALGPDHGETLRSALGLANALSWTGEHEAARAAYDELLVTLRADATGRERTFVLALNGLGFLHQRTGDVAAAIPLYEEAVAVAERSLPPLHTTRALVERNLGLALADDRPEQAVDLLQRAYDARRALLPPGDVLIGKAALDLARVERRLGRSADAAAHTAVAIEVLRDSAPDAAAVAEARVTLADAWIEAGDFDRASAALDSLDAHVGSGAERTRALALRANLHNVKGDFEVAARLYDDVLARRATEEGANSPGYARALHNHAEMLSRMGRAEDALRARERAVSIQRATLAPDAVALAQGRVNLAASHLEAGDADAALARLDEAQPVLEAALGTDHPDLAPVFLLRALARFEQGDAAAARTNAARALEIREVTLGPEHVEVAWTLERLATMDLATGHVATARAHALRADRIAREHLWLAVLTLPERQALSFVTEGRSGRDRLVEIALRTQTDDDVRAAFDAVVRGRALVLDALLERRRHTGPADSTVVAARDALRRARADLITAAMRGDARADQWDRLRDRRDRAEARLAALSLGNRDVLQRRARGPEQVAATLAPGEVLVSTVRVVDHRDEARYAAFVLTPDRTVAIDLGPAAAIENAVEAWLDQARAPITSGDDASLPPYVTAARSLARLVIDPVEPFVRDAARVWWVADGALHRVQPSALVDAENRFLVDRPTVFARLGAERDLVDVTTDAGPGRVLAVGAPDFGDPGDGSPPCPDLGNLRFDPLPGTADEVEALAAATVLRGADAREDRTVELARSHDTLHLATHGFFLDTGCVEGASSVRGLRGIGTVSRRRSVVSRTAPGPLLRSGIALAGANLRATATDPSRDGVLLAEEIAGLDLGAVRTVVLSACDTGVGRVVDGEGVLGLPRAFRQAGARTTVMSLWPIQDEATRRWMEIFDARRREGADVATAVHAAQRETRDAGRRAGSEHPFYWAAFVAIGPVR